MSDGPLFEFALDRLDDVHPWGREPDLTLSWFALTQGRYRLCVGKDFLLNYSDATVAKHEADWPEAYPGPMVDYYVVRLWEDVLGMLPEVLTPVPHGMHEVLLLPDADRTAWIDRITSDMSDNDAMDATEWIGARILDSGYLQNGPWLRLWSHGDRTCVAWDCAGKSRDGIAVWSAGTGMFAMPTADFLGETRAFHERFMAEMEARVEAISGGWRRSGVAIDVGVLQQEQVSRSRAFAAALARPAKDLPTLASQCR